MSTEINAKIIVDQANLYEIVQNIDLESEIESWFNENFDMDHSIESWMNYNFDIDAYIRDIDFSQYLETDNDPESVARDLLNQYSPLGTCPTGVAFTNAVGKAIRFLLLDNDYVDNIVKAINRYNKKEMMQAIENEIKTKVTEEITRNLETEIKQKAISEFSERIATMQSDERERFITNIVSQYSPVQ